MDGTFAPMLKSSTATMLNRSRSYSKPNFSSSHLSIMRGRVQFHRLPTDSADVYMTASEQTAIGATLSATSTPHHRFAEGSRSRGKWLWLMGIQ